MSTRKLNLTDYRIAWICALHIEYTAALAVLDERHADLTGIEDGNVYSCGTVAGHNVVIACLPNGIYGTTSAAVVATRLLSTFRNIELSLMVGIGGGVPGAHDLRLGDVVVSVPIPDCAAVVQYDFGKTTASGHPERKGYLNKPKLKLLTAVTKLRAIHDLKPARTPGIIGAALKNQTLVNAGYTYPGSLKDPLTRSGCIHFDKQKKSMVCGSYCSEQKPQRIENNPKIHYGPIASGNQVMKNSRVRDEIAEPLGILCFEMEAAGLMDDLQCLVVRGICDYCDGRKDDSFQKYAALVAAAYTKELLIMIPRSTSQNQLYADLERTRLGMARQIMEYLKFDEASFRQDAIKNPHADTCQWLPEHPIYKAWLDDSRSVEHHGLLWIKGKPGAGKSTIMKVALSSQPSDVVVISHFFNARGSAIEKSTIGMYRALILQLFQRIPILQNSIDFRALPDRFEDWSLVVLQDLFVRTMKSVGNQTRLFCFVDALDEVEEDDIRDMLGSFTELGRFTSHNQLQFRVCFSSRYYPEISVRFGLEIRLDIVHAHLNDIKTYIDAELLIRQTNERQAADLQEIKDLLLSKSSGIFLWVVLVVRILRKEYDSGRIAGMRKKLLVLPTGLKELFRDVALKDPENNAEFLLSLQLILHVFRPLGVDEYFYAMQHDQDTVTEPWNPESITLADMERHVTSSSKGLAEAVTIYLPDLGVSQNFTSNKLETYLVPRVQFIHESVRDFLTDEASMTSIWPGFKELNLSHSHARIRDLCYDYMIRNGRTGLRYGPGNHYPSSENSRVFHSNKPFPFMSYSTSCILHHANIACSYGNSAKQIFQDEDLLGLLPGDDDPSGNLVRILIDSKLGYLLRLEMIYLECLDDKLRSALVDHALSQRNKDALEGLLKKPCSKAVQLTNDFTCLSKRQYADVAVFAVVFRQIVILEELLSSTNALMSQPVCSLALLTAAQEGQEDVVRLLPQHGPDLQATRQTCLAAFCEEGYKSTPMFMGHILTHFDEYTALTVASRYGHLKIINILLDAGADINWPMHAVYGSRTALQIAQIFRKSHIVAVLKARGAVDPDLQSVTDSNTDGDLSVEVDDHLSSQKRYKRLRMG
ncbi:MAG: hypothetical protein GOMPHAMPRED_005107 [Gomphillus americanus]|uniref:Nucleoside phosphorylase domain-containing protein n=1 Tax=Gomphillus americanus TaxID=1940652 RepID=A0A8H3EKX7_9LECA|nr:MAG: hypothetical protein GOMPHAMPRED_005107 [Gomphillus americanus]